MQYDENYSKGAEERVRLKEMMFKIQGDENVSNGAEERARLKAMFK